MSDIVRSPQTLGKRFRKFMAVGMLTLGACRGTVPSQQIQTTVQLPIPASALTPPSPQRLSMLDPGETYVLSARDLIPIAFDLQPDIKSRYQRFKSEEARYDFFFASRDSLTPRFRQTNQAGEKRRDQLRTRDRDHTVEFSVEKRFFDTTQLDVAVGYRTDAVDEAIGNHPFVSMDLRYPLWASREKLERTSEDIFRRNELDDAQLDYIQEVRRRLQNVLFRFHEVRNLGRQVDFTADWLDDLRALRRHMDSVQERDTSAERRRGEAEIARVSSELRNIKGRHEIQTARFKSACGLPFNAELELVDKPFNPFEENSHAELLRLSIDTDPEIATLRNSMRNAEVQLDLARRGTWDIAVLVGAESSLEGRGEDERVADWSASVGLDVSLVDPRVTGSLSRQAQSNIARFAQAIAARENTIFVDTLEPLVRIDTLSESRDELAKSLQRFIDDYETGIEMFLSGALNIDDILKRRENLFEQQEEISRLKFLVGANVAELCAATGKFFELLEEMGKNGHTPQPGEARNPLD